MSKFCCDERDCTRTQPIKLMYDSLAGVWWFVTRYEVRGVRADGEPTYVALERHRVPAGQARQLDEVLAVYGEATQS